MLDIFSQNSHYTCVQIITVIPPMNKSGLPSDVGVSDWNTVNIGPSTDIATCENKILK